MAAKQKLKKFVFEHKTVYKFCCFLRNFLKSKGKCIVVNLGKARLVKDIQGQNNEIIINQGSCLNDTTIRIRGNNNKISFEKNCSVGPGCSFWMEGNNINIVIGEGTTFTRECHLNAQEDETSIIVGKDCMFSNHVIVRTSDSHPIYNTLTSERTNKADNVVIGDHVWIAPNSKIMKGGNRQWFDSRFRYYCFEVFSS